LQETHREFWFGDQTFIDLTWIKDLDYRDRPDTSSHDSFDFLQQKGISMSRDSGQGTDGSLVRMKT